MRKLKFDIHPKQNFLQDFIKIKPFNFDDSYNFIKVEHILTSRVFYKIHIVRFTSTLIFFPETFGCYVNITVTGSWRMSPQKLMEN